MTHYSFDNLRALLPDPQAQEVQFAYVDGYILALEDLLKDLKDLQAKESAPGSAPLLLEQRVARNGAYGSVRAAINRSLANARDTMTMLKASQSKAQERP